MAQLQQENLRLKKLVVELSLDETMLQDVLSKNGEAFRAECLNAHWFMNLKEAKHLIEAWRREYNDSRPHASLADRTPSEFSSQYAASCILAGT